MSITLPLKRIKSGSPGFFGGRRDWRGVATVRGGVTDLLGGRPWKERPEGGPSKVKTSSSRIRRNDGPRGCTASRKARASLVEGARSRTETLRPRRVRRWGLGHPASWGGLPPPGARDGDEGRQGQPERSRTTVRSHVLVNPPGGSSKDPSRSIRRRGIGDGVTTGSGTGARRVRSQRAHTPDMSTDGAVHGPSRDPEPRSSGARRR